MNETNRYGNGGAPDSGGGAWSETPGAFDDEGWGRSPWETPATGGDGYPQGPTDPYAAIPATDPGHGHDGYAPQDGHAGQGYGGYPGYPGDSGYSGNWGPSGATYAEPAPAYPASRDAGSGGGKGTIAGIIIAVLALAAAGIAVGFAGHQLGWFGGGDGTAASETSAGRDDGATSGSSTSGRPETSRRAEGFTAPASWTHCHGSGAPGDFNLAYAGTGVTSCPFARSVRDAFADHYLDTGNTSGTVDAYSEVTGRTYSMSCTDEGDYVTCRGGNNAVVHIV